VIGKPEDKTGRRKHRGVNNSFIVFKQNFNESDGKKGGGGGRKGGYKLGEGRRWKEGGRGGVGVREGGEEEGEREDDVGETRADRPLVRAQEACPATERENMMTRH